MVLLLFLWSLGTFRVWLEARHRLLLAGHPDIPTGHRGTLELAHVMAEQIDEAADKSEKLRRSKALRLTNKEIGKKLDRLGGGTIRLPGTGEAEFIRDEKPILPGSLAWLDASLLFWFVAALIIAAGQSGNLSQNVRAWLVVVFGSTALAAVLARIIGPTRRWRVLVATLLWLLCFLVGALVTVMKAYRPRR